MKKLRLLFSVGLIAILVSCGSTKDTSTTSSTQNRGRSNQEVSANKTDFIATSKRMSEAEKAANMTAIREAEEMRYAEMRRMYADLDMNQDQIRRFEREWNKIQRSWKRDNPSNIMNNYERIEHQDRILNDILYDTQFENYRRWVRNAAYED